MVKTDKPKIFTKERVANIVSAVVIIWTLWLWTDLLFKVYVVQGSINDVALTILAMWNVITGFAAKHLFDQCSSN